MKTLLLTLVLALTASPILGQTTFFGTDLGTPIRQTYIKCFANRWRGSETTMVPDTSWATNWAVGLSCGRFWEAKRNPRLPTPFTLAIPGQQLQPIPYYIWYPALKDILAISEEPK